MTYAARLLLLMLSCVVFTACSGTSVSDSWSDQSYKGQIRNVYIIGIAKNDLNRMIFEDNFEDRLASEGISTVASYQDLLSTDQEIGREDIIRRMRANDCDTVLLTRVISQRKKPYQVAGDLTSTLQDHIMEEWDPTPDPITIIAGPVITVTET